MANDGKRIILSGMRPTGALHVGNYFGALLPLVKLQDEADEFFIMIADLHALTTLENHANLAKDTISLTAAYLAAGINSSKATIFLQSRIPEHCELATILSMITSVPMLELNPVYKEMREDHPNQNNLGLLSYPVLQTADILLYNTTHVPVGKDQEPHIELAREIARKFNSEFGNYFTEPQIILQKESKIFSLQNPAKKMSKSHGEKTYISLSDSEETIVEKIKIAVTDSEKEIKYDPIQKPAISNLLTLYNLFSNIPIQALENKYQNSNYVEFKNDLAAIINEKLTPIRSKIAEFEKNQDYVKNVLEKGNAKAQKIAISATKQIKNKIGLLQ